MASFTENLQDVTALIADPNPHFAQVLKDILQQFSVRNVLVCDSHESAQGLLARVPVHVVFCDIHVKPGGGLLFLDMVRRPGQAYDETIPVVIMAENARLQQVSDARDRGANEFLVKPTSLKMVERVLRGCFEKPRPFIKAEGYKGPDRRRRRAPVDQDRRKSTR